MPPTNLIQLRQLLADKFPGLGTRADELPLPPADGWKTGLPGVDAAGGIPGSAITELVARHGAGGASLLAWWMRRAADEGRFVALVDGLDSFDAAVESHEVLSRLLWLRCRSADEAMKAADLVLRDGNIPFVFLDLALNPAAQVRRIPSPAWHRFQRITEERGVTLVVATPEPVASPARLRLTLRARLELDALECDADELARDLDIVVEDSRRAARWLKTA
jgi:hypothetical protein